MKYLEIERQEHHISGEWWSISIKKEYTEVKKGFKCNKLAEKVQAYMNLKQFIPFRNGKQKDSASKKVKRQSHSSTFGNAYQRKPKTAME